MLMESVKGGALSFVAEIPITTGSDSSEVYTGISNVAVPQNIADYKFLYMFMYSKRGQYTNVQLLIPVENFIRQIQQEDGTMKYIMFYQRGFTADTEKYWDISLGILNENPSQMKMQGAIKGYPDHPYRVLLYLIR